MINIALNDREHAFYRRGEQTVEYVLVASIISVC